MKPEEDFEGYTGNEGMTLDRWYRHAAIFLWPERRHFEIICDQDGRHVVPELERLSAQWKKAGRKDSAALKTQCLGLAAAILATWKEDLHEPEYAEIPVTGDLLKTLMELDDIALIRRFLGEVLVKDVSVDPGKSMTMVCKKYGWETFKPELTAAIKGTTAETLERNARLVENICLAKPRKIEGWSELCGTLAEEMVSALERVDRAKTSNDWGEREPDRSQVLADLARALLATEQTELLSHFLTHALAARKKYPLTTGHVPALVRLQPWLAKNLKENCVPVSQWVVSCREQLETLTDKAPREPADFRRSASISCSCKECAELKRFLADPREPEHRFSAGKSGAVICKTASVGTAAMWIVRPNAADRPIRWCVPRTPRRTRRV